MFIDETPVITGLLPSAPLPHLVMLSDGENTPAIRRVRFWLQPPLPRQAVVRSGRAPLRPRTGRQGTLGAAALRIPTTSLSPAPQF